MTYHIHSEHPQKIATNTIVLQVLMDVNSAINAKRDWRQNI